MERRFNLKTKVEEVGFLGVFRSTRKLTQSEINETAPKVAREWFLANRADLGANTRYHYYGAKQIRDGVLHIDVGVK
jgi:hypothetical protein